MKKLRLLFLIIVLPFIGLAQGFTPMPDSNAVWSEYNCYDLNGAETCNMFFTAIQGDTLIDTNTYHKLYRWKNDSTMKGAGDYIAAFRQNMSGEVFVVWEGGAEEYLFYDFKSQAGDTIIVQRFKNDKFKLHVDSTGSILLNSGFRKTFMLSSEDGLKSKWIDGIGSITGVLYPSTDFLSNQQERDLICFRENGTRIYQNPQYSSCYITPTSISKRAVNLNIPEVYPNPLNNNRILYVEYLSGKSYSLLIIDLLGRTVEKISNIDEKIKKVDLSGLQKGVYLYRIESDETKPLTGKLIIK